MTLNKKWIVRLLGPFPDEIGWGAVISKWTILGVAVGFILHATILVNPWDEVAWCIGFILFTIAAFTGY